MIQLKLRAEVLNRTIIHKFIKTMTDTCLYGYYLLSLKTEKEKEWRFYKKNQTKPLAPGILYEKR